MAELTTSELNIFFNEAGEITMGGGLHMKVILPGTPTVKTIQALVDRVHEYRDSQPEEEHWLPETESESVQPPQDEQERAPTEPPAQQGNRPRGGATEPQCKKILAICHRLDDNTVIEAIKGYPAVEWHLDADGHCLPNWDFLRSLTMQKASTVIERLERAES